MQARSILNFIAVWALVSVSCGISFQIPVDRIVTGPTQTEEIDVPIASEENVTLELDFGAGEFKLNGGAGSNFVTGQAIFNVNDFKPTVETTANRVVVKNGNLDIRGLPRLNNEMINRWDLQLGNIPMDLEISAGAYSGDFDLGDVALRSLRINDGAANVNLNFSAPNPVEMGTFNYSTGASTVHMTGLANANFEQMVFHSGLGEYTLDFSGEFKRDALVSIESGVSQVTIIVPQGMTAQVFLDGSLSAINLSGGWERGAQKYEFGSGSGPILTIQIKMGAGSLKLGSS